MYQYEHSCTGQMYLRSVEVKEDLGKKGEQKHPCE